MNNLTIVNGRVVSNPEPNLQRGGGIYSTGTLTLNNSVVRENQVVKNSADNTLLGGGIALSSFQPTVINNTRIHDNRIVPSSPAINAGNNCVLTNNCGDNFDLGFNLTTDGRGAGFPRQFGTSNIDIGAFESSVPTAASVSIGGRIFDANGRGAARTVVLLTNSAGETRAAFTNPFGFYRFADVPAGETYIVAPRHKQFGFAPQVLFVDGARDDLDFIAVAP